MDIRVILVCAVISASGCDVLSKGCTLVGCEDGFTANVRSADGSFPSGAHRIEVLADTASLTCTFAYPFARPGDNASCGVDLRVAVWEELACTETQCEPIPGKFYEAITVPGTPAQVHVWQYVDDMAILDAAVAPTYKEVAPNGRECGPICRQATVSWMFSD